jgi:flavodoxin
MDPTRKPRVLVVYYSRTGNTACVAEGLARACEADVEAIRVSIPRSGLLGYLFSGFEAMFERDSLILPPQRNPHDYDIVLIGGPIWNSTISSPIRAYFKRFAGLLPSVAFFVTSGGGKDERALLQMAELSGKKPLAVLGLRERDLKGRFAVYLGEFWESVISAWEARFAPSTEPPRA